jgi:hypothetical protein
MHLAAVVAVAWALPMQADTVVVLGAVERDLTGDGRPEVLRLVGEGNAADSLAVTFSIESSGQVLFRTALASLTRMMGFDAGRREVPAAEHRTRLDEYGRWFFGESKFMRPDTFVARLRQSARRHEALIPDVIERDRRRQAVVDSLVRAGQTILDAERTAQFRLRRRGAPYDTAHAAETWDEIRRTGVTVFQYSPGGDGLTAIAWSERDRRFYRLLECC